MEGPTRLAVPLVRYLAPSALAPPRGLTTLKAVERHSTRVVRALAQNPGAFTLQGTNTYVVGDGAHRWLVDAGDAPTANLYIDNLREAMECAGAKRLAGVILTHHHHDHVGGVNAVKQEFGDDVPVYKMPHAADTTSAIALKDGDVLGADGVLRRGGCAVLEGAPPRATGATLRVLHTPGHTADHVSLILEEEQAVFTGDCVLGESTPVFEDLTAYMASLRALLEIFEASNAVLYPSHGRVVQDGAEHVRLYIDHRERREEDILEKLDQAGGRATPWTLVGLIYKNLALPVRIGAVGVVLQHVEKLEREGKVRRISHGSACLASAVLPSAVSDAALVTVERV